MRQLKKQAVFTGAAHYARVNAKTAVVIITNVTLRQATILAVEEAALALAIAPTLDTAIVTDSQAACRKYTVGRIVNKHYEF